MSGGTERRIALVTGASRGIGRATAVLLASSGLDVAITYAGDEAGAGETLAQVEAAGARGISLKADVRDPASVDAAFKQIEDELGAPLVLVNNAGVRHDNLALRLSDEDWSDTLNTNLTGAFNCSRTALRAMVRARFGRIVMVSSVAGLHGNPGQAAYGASKAGMVGLARTLAKEYARKNVTVNVVAPGPVATAMTEGLVEKIAEAVPLGRPGTVEEIAAAIGFLVSDEAAYITGAVLPVDGGMTA